MFCCNRLLYVVRITIDFFNSIRKMLRTSRFILKRPFLRSFSLGIKNENPKSLLSASILQSIRNPEWKEKIAIIDTEINSKITYQQLDEYSNVLAQKILENEAQSMAHSQDPSNKSIGAFHKPGLTFTLAMLASWKLQRTFVPLCITHSWNEVSYVVEDSGVGTLVCHDKSVLIEEVKHHYKSRLIEDSKISYAKEILLHVPFDEDKIDINESEKENALVIYTSGTTGRPKGVVHTHSSLQHMTASVTSAWQYSHNDKILHFLPLYHVHGLLNKLLCVLHVGGTVEFMKSAQAALLWQRLAQETIRSDKQHDQELKQQAEMQHHHNHHHNHHHQHHAHDGPSKQDKLTMFMAVPTVYAKMLEFVRLADKNNVELQKTIRQGIEAMQHMRLMVSGSAALPDVLMNQWRELTGQVLLERYGMTEIGMALTNPYDPVSSRRPGSVGRPFPFVQARLVDERTGHVIDDTPNGTTTPGELQIAGPVVFKEYLNRPDATQDSFVIEKHGQAVIRWFKTGDIAERDASGVYKILGRASADIIKSGGFKISALEIERELLSHDDVAEVAVCATPDTILGESIVAVVAVRETRNAADLRHNMEEYLKTRLAKYKQPRDWIFITAGIPRNHMGKVNKKTLLKEVQNLPQLK